MTEPTHISEILRDLGRVVAPAQQHARQHGCTCTPRATSPYGWDVEVDDFCPLHGREVRR